MHIKLQYFIYSGWQNPKWYCWLAFLEIYFLYQKYFAFLLWFQCACGYDRFNWLDLTHPGEHWLLLLLPTAKSWGNCSLIKELFCIIRGGVIAAPKFTEELDRAILPLLWKPCSPLVFTGAEKTHFPIFFEMLRSIWLLLPHHAIFVDCGIAIGNGLLFRKADRKQTLIFCLEAFCFE